MTSSYGDRINPVLNKEEFHNGIDIGVPINTNLIAISNGVITEVGDSKTFGKYIKYKTGNFTVFYAHLNSILAKIGDFVDQNQIIALSGNTGLSTGAHLHISLWLNDKLVDPNNYFNYFYTEEVKKEIQQRGDKNK